MAGEENGNEVETGLGRGRGGARSQGNRRICWDYIF